jgi:hypothetical protein
MLQTELLRRYFFTRTDIAANFVAAWGKPCPIRLKSEADLMLCLEAHTGLAKHSAEHFTSKGIVGQREVMRLGSYTPDTKKRTRWLCIDFDGKGHGNALESPLAIAQLTISRALAYGLTPHLEKSGGGRGWHTWFFFDEPMDARSARALGLGLVPRDAPLIDGGVADPEHHKAIEVFPKIGELQASKGGETTGIGHMVWLPFWGRASQGAASFYEPDGETELLIDDFETTDPYAAKEALAKIAELLETTNARTPVAQTDRRFESADWDSWRARVYAEIPFEGIYRLTGKNFGNGWLEARTAEGDDKNPSAAVSDGSGAARGLYHDYRNGETLNVIDYVMRYHCNTDSFTEAARWIAERFGFALPEARRQGPQLEPPPIESPEDYFSGDPKDPETLAREQEKEKEPRKRTRINVKDDERDQIEAIWVALQESEQPIYHWGGIPVYLFKGSTESIDSHWFRYIVSQEVEWFKYGSGKKGQAVIIPEKGASTTIGAALSSVRMFASELKTVVRAPIYTPDRRLLTEPGYDPTSKIYYHKTCDVPKVAEDPTPEQMKEAHKLIFSSLLRDFPFEDQRSLAHAVAALLTPFVRLMIDGSTPLYVYEAPRPGTGKSLLAELVPTINRGFSAPITLDQSNNQENKKLITAALLKEPGGIVFIDNFRGMLGDPFLEAIITAQMFEDRVLGVTKNVRAANLSTWLISSNNPAMNADTHRRAIVIRLDARTQRPELRDSSSFKIHPLKPWVRENRGRLVWSLLTMIQRWLADGAVHAPVTLGSFEVYAGVVGGILQSNGVDGFLQHRAEEVSADDLEWEHFCCAWWDRHSGDFVTAGKLLDSVIFSNRDLLATQLAKANSERGMVSTIGMILHRRMGQVVRLREIRGCPAVQLVRSGRNWKLVATDGKPDDSV